MSRLILLIPAFGILLFSFSARSQSLNPATDTGCNCSHPTNKETQDFEKAIQDLLRICKGNDFTSCLGRAGKDINFVARKNLFTQKGWDEYLKYNEIAQRHLASDHLNNLKELYVPKFEDQHYGHAYDEYSYFTAFAHFWAADGDEVVPHVSVITININFSPRQSPAQPFIIDGWNVKIYSLVK